MYQSNRSFNIPPGHTPGIDAISCPGGREFDHRSLPRGGAFDHHLLGVGNLIASLHFMSRVPLIPRELTNHCGDSKETIADSWQIG